MNAAGVGDGEACTSLTAAVTRRSERWLIYNLGRGKIGKSSELARRAGRRGANRANSSLRTSSTHIAWAPAPATGAGARMPYGDETELISQLT